jgi:hypothetical protein
MLIFITVAASLAAPLSLRADVDGAMGMSAGGSALLTTNPWSHLDAGLYVSAMTDLYSFAPEPITWGLDRHVNLHLAPMAAVGWSQPVGRWTFGGYLMAGPELMVIRETRTVPALDEPIEYKHHDWDFHGGVLPTVRWMPTDHWGANFQFLLPLPWMPTGNPDFERMHFALGVTWLR